MADFEDANAPTWNNCIDGQRNLIDANRRTISWRSTDGRRYELGRSRRALRPSARLAYGREAFSTAAARPSPHRYSISGCTSSTTAGSCSTADRPRTSTCPSWRAIAKRGCGTTSSCSRNSTSAYRSVRSGATVLIETISAAFEMDEILYELRDHSAGLNCGRWDYIFSFIKKFRNRRRLRAAAARRRDHGAAVPPLVCGTADPYVPSSGAFTPWAEWLRRFPSATDAAANEEAMQRVREDKLREVRAGHDGTWVAHPGTGPVARAVFDEYMPEKNQIENNRVPHT